MHSNPLQNKTSEFHCKPSLISVCGVWKMFLGCIYSVVNREETGNLMNALRI